MAAVCESCKKEGLNRPGIDADNIEYGQDVMVSLEIAAADGHSDCLRAIINTAANVNCRNQENLYTPLVWAARYGHPECIEVLIKAGADVNKTARGVSALMLASGYEGNIRCIELLLEAGADVNHKTWDGETALMEATGCGHPEVVKQLIKAGADVNKVKDKYGWTALHKAAERDDQCFEILLEAGADVNLNEAWMSYLYPWRYDRAEKMIEAGADVNMEVQGYNYGSALFMAAVNSSPETVRLLLRSGININKLNKEGYNALERYLSYNHLQLLKDVCMLLLGAGESVTQVLRKQPGWDGGLVTLPDYLTCDAEKLHLKHICRMAIREHLLELDPHTHLFGRVPRLGLPAALSNYLLFNMSIKKTPKS